jgi:hypothetical protein
VAEAALIEQLYGVEGSCSGNRRAGKQPGKRQIPASPATLSASPIPNRSASQGTSTLGPMERHFRPKLSARKPQKIGGGTLHLAFPLLT